MCACVWPQATCPPVQSWAPPSVACPVTALNTGVGGGWGEGLLFPKFSLSVDWKEYQTPQREDYRRKSSSLCPPGAGDGLLVDLGEKAQHSAFSRISCSSCPEERCVWSCFSKFVDWGGLCLGRGRSVFWEGGIQFMGHPSKTHSLQGLFLIPLRSCEMGSFKPSCFSFCSFFPERSSQCSEFLSGVQSHSGSA